MKSIFNCCVLQQTYSCIFAVAYLETLCNLVGSYLLELSFTGIYAENIRKADTPKFEMYENKDGW